MYFKLFLKLQFSQRSRVYTQNYKTERILSELCVTEISTLGVAVIPFAWRSTVWSKAFYPPSYLCLCFGKHLNQIKKFELTLNV